MTSHAEGTVSSSRHDNADMRLTENGACQDYFIDDERLDRCEIKKNQFDKYEIERLDSIKLRPVKSQLPKVEEMGFEIID